MTRQNCYNKCSYLESNYGSQTYNDIHTLQTRIFSNTTHKFELHSILHHSLHSKSITYHIIDIIIYIYYTRCLYWKWTTKSFIVYFYINVMFDYDSQEVATFLCQVRFWYILLWHRSPAVQNYYHSNNYYFNWSYINLNYFPCDDDSLPALAWGC